MKVVATPLAGCVVLEQERLVDERGFFARTFDPVEMEEAGLDGRVAQCSTSFNAAAGTLRGLHFQAAPHGEAKTVRCTRGAILDVAVDLRPASATYRGWYGTELSAENGRALHVPEGFAHGFQTLQDASEVLYVMSVPYAPGAGRGVRWDEPAFAIVWPAPPAGGRVLSERDATYPNLA